jgi:uncharacterized membrane protein YfcA
VTYVILALLGSIVGLASSLLGLGGSVFIIPLLPSVIALPLKTIIYTSIFSVMMVTLFNVVMFQRKGLVDWRLGATLIPLVSMGSFVSSYFSHYFSDIVVKGLLVAIMITMVLRLLVDRFDGTVELSSLKERVIKGLAGTLSGGLAGLTGIGSGVILGPTLLSLKLTDPKKVSPTINLLIFCTCFFSILGNLQWSTLTFKEAIRFDLSVTIFLFSIFGSYFGRKINNSIPPRKRKIVVGLTLLALALKVFIQF